MMPASNRRAEALLRLAHKYGHEITHDPDGGHWLVRGPDAPMDAPALSVHPRPRHAVLVLHNTTGGRWRQITQTDARTLLVHHCLGEQKSWTQRRQS